MLTDYQARDLVIDAAIGFDADGRITALHTHNTSNIGAHSASWIPLVKGIEIPRCSIKFLPRPHVLSRFRLTRRRHIPIEVPAAQRSCTRWSA